MQQAQAGLALVLAAMGIGQLAIGNLPILPPRRTGPRRNRARWAS